MPTIVLLTNWERLDLKSKMKLFPCPELVKGEGVPHQQGLMNPSVDNPLPAACVYDWLGLSLNLFSDVSL